MPETPLRLYSLDCGVYGLTVVLAPSLEEAITLIQDERPNLNIARIQVHDLESGLVISNLGDT